MPPIDIVDHSKSPSSEPVISRAERRSFYAANLPILPPYARWRQFKFRLESGLFKSIRERIRKPEHLQFMCLRYLPLDVYCTVSCWLQPDYLTARGLGFDPKQRGNPSLRVPPNTGSNVLSSNLFLWSDLVLDLDSAHCSPKNIHRLYLWAQSRFSKVSWYQTHSGFHIWCFPWFRSSHPDPRQREAEDQGKRRELIAELRFLRLQCDFSILSDTRRLVRVANTLHREGVVIRKLDHPPFVSSANFTSLHSSLLATGNSVLDDASLPDSLPVLA